MTNNKSVKIFKNEIVLKVTQIEILRELDPNPLVNGRSKLLDQLFGAFQNSLQETIANLKLLAINFDPQKVRKVVHKAKSSVGSFGALRLWDLCEHIETHNDLDAEKLKSYIVTMESEYNRALQEIQTEVNKKAS